MPERYGAPFHLLPVANHGRDIFDKLMLPENAARIIDELQSRADIGMIGPAGHFVDMESYMGDNEPLL